jgi:hypothetical protein
MNSASVNIAGVIGYQKDGHYYYSQYYLGATYEEATETMREIIRLRFSKINIIK